MTINLPQNLEAPILAAVHSGRYGSLDDAMAAAALLLVQQLEQEQAQTKGPEANHPEAGSSHRQIWEEIEELAASIPVEEFRKLPVDGAEQLDHYIYGIAKLPPSQ
jgi:Arc/MetJ-type ribon-helix-helix transcriptional regulator